MNNFELGQVEFEEASKKERIKSIIESILFVTGEPLSLRDIAINLEMPPRYVEEVLNEMILDYEASLRGIKLISIKGEYQLVTKSENSDYIQKLLKKNKRQSLSQASLESLAIIAYKQPITRIDIDEIREVKSESAIQKLIEKNLIKESGRLDVPGRPILYSTTNEFLRQFELNDLKELPSLDLFEDTTDDDIEEILNESEIEKNF